MAINVGMGFKVGNMEPIDTRFIMSKAEMLAVTPATQPDVYFCVCSDDSLMYIYNSNNSDDPDTGKFRCISVDGTNTVDMSEYQKIIDDTLTTLDKTVPGAINELLTLINDKLSVPTMDGVENDVLTRDIDGNVIWKAIPDVDLSGKLDKPVVDGTAGQILALQDDGSLAYVDNTSGYDDTEIREALDNKLDKEKVVQDLTVLDTESTLSTEGLNTVLETKVDKIEGSSLVADTEIAKIHEHANQDVLDNLTKDADSGKLLFEGNPISVDVPIATVDEVGAVKPDGTTITITDDGTITAIGSGGSAVLTEDITTNIEVGGIKSGTFLGTGLTFNDYVRMVHVIYLAPGVTLNITPSTTLYKVGTTVTGLVAKVTVTKKSEDITKIEFLVNDVVKETVTTDVANGGTFSYTIDDFTTDTTIKVLVYDTEESVPKTSTVKFVNPYYCGTTDDVPTADTIATLTELVEAKGSKTRTITCANQHVVIAYPASYGKLTSILDGNGFENLTDYTNIQETINNVNYEIYYTTGKKTLTNFKYTYK